MTRNSVITKLPFPARPGPFFGNDLSGKTSMRKPVMVLSGILAVNVYVLIVIFFAFFYAVLSLLEPNAFIGKFMDQPLRDQVFGFVYFSFVTLTTLGFGDITPSGAFVATLTYLEALIGQLYVAIMIARLVGLYLTRRG